MDRIDGDPLGIHAIPVGRAINADLDAIASQVWHRFPVGIDDAGDPDPVIIVVIHVIVERPTCLDARAIGIGKIL